MTDDSTPDNGKKSVSRRLWYVYLIECADGSLYTGSTTDVERRLRQHNGELAGGARYTRVRRPVALLWRHCVPDRSAALRLEVRIKGLNRRQKMALIKGVLVLSTEPKEAGNGNR